MDREPSAPAAQIEFDPVRHIYAVQGRKVLSVTQVLRIAGVLQTGWYNEEAMHRGARVAVATALDDRDDLDPESCEDIMGYVESWRSFLRSVKHKIIAIEERVYQPVWRFAGTLDRRMSINGKPFIVDIKTGSAEPWHALQTAAYGLCFTPNAGYERAAVYLESDGRFKFVQHRDGNDTTVFAPCANVANWIVERYPERAPWAQKGPKHVGATGTGRATGDHPAAAEPAGEAAGAVDPATG